MLKNVRYCMGCYHPETKPGISFNPHGLCNACEAAKEYYQQDFAAKWQEFKHIALDAKTAAKQRGCDYDCVVPVSGGKDSMYICWKCEEVGLRVLGIFVKPMLITERGQANINNLSRFFPTMTYTVPDHTLNMPAKLWESYMTTGRPLQPYDDCIYGIPEKIAADMGIPLVVRGEASETFYGNPPETAQQYDHLATRNIYLSNYIRWDSQTTAEFGIQHGLSIRTPDELWGTGGYWTAEQLDDRFPIVSHWLKYLKFGYGRATDHACRDLRAGRIPTDTQPVAETHDGSTAQLDKAYRAAAALIRKYDGQIDHDAYTDWYCRYCGKTRQEFMEVARGWDRYGVL